MDFFMIFGVTENQAEGKLVTSARARRRVSGVPSSSAFSAYADLTRCCDWLEVLM